MRALSSSRSRWRPCERLPSLGKALGKSPQNRGPRPGMKLARIVAMYILVIEDDPAGAEFLSRGLREEGFAVDAATDADQAVDAVRLCEYDAIVLDVMLPVQDGFSLCRRWRADGIAAPILFLTAR